MGILLAGPYALSGGGQRSEVRQLGNEKGINKIKYLSFIKKWQYTKYDAHVPGMVVSL
jgi:hypothetical protein